MSKKVVIIGHGLSGRTVAENLVKGRGKDSSINLVCIDSREFYECDSLMTVPLTWGGEESYNNNSCPQWKLAVPGVDQYICDSVKSVTKTGDKIIIVTDKSGSIEADAVVAATGFHVPVVKPQLGATWSARKNELAKYREAIAKAKTIVVAGSGACGLDVAGDVRVFADIDGGAKVHLIVSGEHVLGKNCSNSDRALLTSVVRSAPGMVLHNDRVVGDDYNIPSLDKKTVKLKSGKAIEADVYLPSFATWNGDSYLSNTDGVLAENGMIIQDKRTLQSKAMPALFAVGCGNIVLEEGFVGIPKIEAQAKTVATNVLKFLNGQPLLNHKEGASFTKHEPLVHFGHGYHSQILTDDCGMPGKCCVWCGFPFPCIICPCTPCGITCMRPNLRYVLGKIKNFAFKGDVPMLQAARANKQNPPSIETMTRD